MSSRSYRRPRNRGLHKAAQALGGQTALGNAIGERQSTIWEWIYKSGKPNPEKCPDIERLTGIPCEELHPAFQRLAELRAS